jgi:glycosyltransferase involved in cell wall biosynthesis
MTHCPPSPDERKLSIILPARNESGGLARLLPELTRQYGRRAEIIVVDDGSEDATAEIARSFPVRLISHPYSMGNGAAIKSGLRAALGEILVFMDADGQHRPEDVSRLLAKMNDGYDMVVGARSRAGQANIVRWAGNSVYNGLASWIVGQHIQDLTSGLRAVRADKAREFLPLLPNTFSYPTTLTMAFFRAGYQIAYIPIFTDKRIGKSHIKIGRDALRFLLIIFKIGTLYSPLKIFMPLSFLFLSSGLGYYMYTYLSHSRFTNMSALLLSTSVVIFLIGLVSEQITQLIYMTSRNKP